LENNTVIIGVPKAFRKKKILVSNKKIERKRVCIVISTLKKQFLRVVMV